MTFADTALAVIEMARRGEFTGISDKFLPQLRPLAPPEALRAAWDAEVAKNGQVSALGTPLTEAAGPGTVLVKVPVTFERATATLAVGLAGEEGEAGEEGAGDQGPWITGIQLLPASAAAPVAPWEPPPYADPDAFTEHDVTVGDGPLAVPGTLSVPRRAGQAPLPGVVLLAGSGPNDQDETIGRNKPLKDLAWGLATAGVAVLRFEKVTRAHPDLVAGNPHFTLTDEYVPQAVAAIGLLRGHPAVDPARVFVAGHSEGGTAAPRVAARAPVAGLVILAGGAQPLHHAMVRQFRYLASLAAAQGAAPPADIDAITRQAAAVDDPALSESTPSSDLPFGVPAAYWLDLRGYDPPAAAAALGKPLLIVQGGRDYQATVADDLSRWQAALDGLPDVTIRVYPADNHLFFPGEGPSSPAEYEPAQHVDPAVVAGIAAWLTAGAPQ
jgi:dienelactone hydrolase